MDVAWPIWILMPLIGALIGYATNWLAIRMLFRPRRPVLGFQGLLPRRQDELAQRVAEVVAGDLVRADRLLEPLQEVDLRPHVEQLLDEAVERKMDDLRKLPLVGSLLKPEMLGGIKRSLLDEFDRRQPMIKQRLAEELVERVDVAAIAAAELAGLDLDRLEQAVLRVARGELRSIEHLGAILGAVIGVVQAACLHLFTAGT